MAFPTGGYEPRWPGVVELNLGDHWRARWVSEQSLPSNAPVDYAYALIYMGDKGYLTRRAGDEVWGTVEGAPQPGEKPDAFVKRAAREQAGAVVGKVGVVGFLECRATSHNPDHPVGTVRVRPFFLVGAKEVKDLGGRSTFERRRLPINEHLVALRRKYPEFEDYIGKASDLYAVWRAKGEA